MTRRLLAGERTHPTTGEKEMGLWLSVPNRDVLTALGDNLLISPYDSNLAFLSSGVVTVGVNQTKQVNFLAAELGFIPFIMHQLGDVSGGRAFLPAHQNYRSTYLQYFTDRYAIDVSSEWLRVRHTNADRGFYVRFIITTVPQ